MTLITFAKNNIGSTTNQPELLIWDHDTESKMYYSHWKKKNYNLTF